jgi:putative ABC transport system permease protein
MHLESWWGDLRIAARNAARRPGFTLLVALTLALGLGVNSAVFALVDAVLLRPLPYRDPSRLVFIWQTLPQQNVFEVEAAPFDYSAWQSLRSLSSIAMINYSSFTLTGGGDEPERIRGARVTSSLMPMLGVAPAFGRAFVAAEDREDAPATVIVSDGLWRRRFGSASAILGQSIEIDGMPRTIVGVMPRGARLPGAAVDGNELWLPMRLSPEEAANEISHNYTMVGRLADGVSMSAASAELDAFASRMAAERPSHVRMGARFVSVEERTVRALRPALVVATSGVALLLLVAAANASTLLVARAANRRHELAVRAALGATRGRLLSQSIAECVMLAGFGGVAGLLLGRAALRTVVTLFAGSLPSSLAIAIDARAILLTLAAAIAIGVVSGAVAAYRPGDAGIAAMSGARSTTSRASERTRHALVAAQIALAVVLLSGAGLLLSSTVKLSRVNPGFAPDHVLTFRVSLLGPRYAAAPARAGLVTDALARFAAVPGVRAAGVSSVVPFAGMRNANAVEIEGRSEPQGSRTIIDQRHVSAGYFQAIRIAIVSGRFLAETDDLRSERVIVINRTMARRYFPNESPINRRVRTTAGFDAGAWCRIVGVVEDVRHLALDRDPIPEMYHPIAQTAVPGFTFVVRTAGDPTAMTAAARGVLHAIDPNLPIYEIRTMDERIAASFAQTRATMLLLIATALLAAALAGIAIYGAIWYSVLQRTQEIGIRVALGASRASIFRRVVGRAVTLAAGGAAAGVAIAAGGGSLLRAMLFDTRTTDPLTFIAVIAGVLTLSVCASIVPAFRAMRVDPIIAVRNE